MHAQTGGWLSRNARAADPECFNGSQERTKQFVQSICIAITMQIDTFEDGRMKILYVLSFMHGGMGWIKSGLQMRPMQCWLTGPHSTPLWNSWKPLRGPLGTQTTC